MINIKDIKKVFETKFMNIKEYTLEEETNKGIAEYKRLCMDRGNAVVIIPYDKEKQSVVLIRQARIGTIADGDLNNVLEFPAGMIDDGEDLIETAKRELLEETGLESINIEQIYKSVMYTSVGASNEKLYYFLAEVNSEKVLKNTGKKNEHEYITTEIVSIKNLFEMVFEEQRINTSYTILSTFLLKEYINK